MNIKFLTIALGIAFTAFTLNARAQKTYTEGLATYGLTTPAGSVESKVYFTADSSAAVTQRPPATIKVITNTKDTYAAILVDVPIASIKKAAVLTPDEVDQMISQAPKFTFTPTTETKQINGFNCKKVTAKDTKTGNTYPTWVTSDVSAPTNSMTKLFTDAGGFPVQFTTIQQGQVVEVVLKSMSDQKPAPGTFSTKGYDKITLDDLKAMSGGR
jgi:hypothetical protein